MASVPVLLRLVLFGPVFSVQTSCVPVSPLSPGPEEAEADGEGEEDEETEGEAEEKAEGAEEREEAEGEAEAGEEAGEGAGPEEAADGEAESGEEEGEGEGEGALLLGRGLEERGLLMVLSRMKCDAARMEVSWIRVRRERFLWSWPSSGMRSSMTLDSRMMTLRLLTTTGRVLAQTRRVHMSMAAWRDAMRDWVASVSSQRQRASSVVSERSAMSRRE